MPAHLPHMWQLYHCLFDSRHTRHMRDAGHTPRLQKQKISSNSLLFLRQDQDASLTVECPYHTKRRVSTWQNRVYGVSSVAPVIQSHCDICCGVASNDLPCLQKHSSIVCKIIAGYRVHYAVIEPCIHNIVRQRGRLSGSVEA